jgi:uracil-xanthine permease
MSGTISPVRTAEELNELDSWRPIGRTILYGVQHFLVMAATPISSVFLVAAVLGLEESVTLSLLAASLILSGVGSVIQSFGIGPFGPRLPFVMLPGGAPVILFIGIAEQHSAQVATGAVILTGVFYFVVLPVFTRLLRFFPALVIGTMITVVGVNLVKVGAQLMFGRPGTPEYGDLTGISLGMATILITVVAVLVSTGIVRRIAPMIGLLGGTAIAFAIGAASLDGVGEGGVVNLPTLFPFGSPEFNLLAAVPLLIFSIASMAEATGQTVINSEAVGRTPDVEKDVPRTIRGDALVSTAGGFFGMPLMVTSGENVGIVRMTGVRSRFVTVVAGIILILVGLFAPVVRLINAIPEAVIGGTAIVVFGVIIVLGVQMLARANIADHTTMFIVAVSLGLGLIPILLPAPYAELPTNLRIILESGVAVSTFSAVVLNALLNHGPIARRRARAAQVGEA